MHGTKPPAKGIKVTVITATDFLTRLFGASPTFLCTFANDKSEKKQFPSRDTVTGKPGDAEAFITEYDVDGRAVYFAINEMQGSKRDKDHVAAIRAAYIDIDFKTVVEDRSEIEAVLSGLTLKPSAVVFSGHGLHVYWTFDKPLPPETTASFEALLKRLCKVLAGDTSAAEVARVLRLPGSHNTKDGESHLVEVIERLSSWESYTYAEVDRWCEDQPVLLNYRPVPERENNVIHLNEYQKLARDLRKESGRGADIDELIARMEHKGAQDNAINKVRSDVVGILVSRGATVQDAVDTLLGPSRDAYLRSPHKTKPWNDKEEIRHIVEKFEYYTERDARKAKAANDEPIADDENETRGGLPPLAFINVGAWQDATIPDREWAVDGVIPLAVPDLFSGEGGTGKSTLSLQVGVSHALECDWLGMNVKPGNFMYFSAEDDENELHRRLGKILQYNKAEFRDVADRMYLKAVDDAVLASVEKSGIVKPTKLYKQLLQAVQDVRPVRLVLDSSADVFAGNEINRSEVRQFIGLMRHLCRAGNTTVTILAHPSLSGISSGSGTSGSTAWHNSVRSRSYFSTPKAGKDEEEIDPNVRLLEFKKNNYGPAADSLSLLWTDGFFQVVSGGAAYVIDAGRNKLCDETFIKMLKRFEQQKRYVSANQYSKTFAPLLFAKEDDAKKEGFGKAQFEAAMRRLFVAQRIENVTYGSPSRETTRLMVLK